MNQLNRSTIGIYLPDYPIKILQFGGGRFQRGFTNWIIQRLNEDSTFQASVLLVKPTEAGDYDQLKKQDGLYHVLLSSSNSEYDVTLVSNIARIIHPYREWSKFLETARLPMIRWVISNTTESGLTDELVEELHLLKCPHSFPAKLTIWLYERFNFFEGDIEKGCYILPLELVKDSGPLLLSKVIRCADALQLGFDFKEWVYKANLFCSTLVDRIVSGFPHLKAERFFAKTGFQDQLMVQGEAYNSWIIQGSDKLAKELGIDQSKLNIQIVDDITPYYQVKVRILNGMHTALVGLGLLSGYKHVHEAIRDEHIYLFLKNMVVHEVLPTIHVDLQYLHKYFEETIRRFLNPGLRHQLESIALNTTAKFTTRLFTTLKDYVQNHYKIPKHISFVLACIIFLYKCEDDLDEIGIKDNSRKKELMRNSWQDHPDIDTAIAAILGEKMIWDADLNSVSGLIEEVVIHFTKIEKKGVLKAMEDLAVD